MERYQIGSITESMAMSSYYGPTPEDKASMNLPFMLHLKGKMNKDRLEDSIRKVLSQNILHSYVSFSDNQFFFNEKKMDDFKLEVVKTEGDSEEEKIGFVNEFAKKQALEPLPLFEKDKPQYFFKLYEIDENYHILVMIVHHTFLDFGAVSIAIKYIFSFYNTDDYKMEDSAEFSKFMGEELSFLASEDAKMEDEYWTKELEGYTAQPLKEDEDNDNPILTEQECMCLLDRKELDEMANQYRTSTSNIIMLMIQMAIAKANDSNDTLVQYAISNRSELQYRYTLGCLTRILCNRMDFDDDMTVTELNKVMRKKLGGGYQNRHVAGKTPLGAVPYVIANEDMGDLDITPMFGNNPIPIEFVDLPRKFTFVAMLIMPIDIDKIAIGILTDMKAYGRHAKKIVDNVALAAKFMNSYPNKTFGDYMRKDINIDTLDLLNEEDSVEIIEI